MQFAELAWLLSIRVLTLKPISNWINWNQLTKFGFNDSLNFTLVIGTGFVCT